MFDLDLSGSSYSYFSEADVVYKPDSPLSTTELDWLRLSPSTPSVASVQSSSDATYCYTSGFNLVRGDRGPPAEYVKVTRSECGTPVRPVEEG